MKASSSNWGNLKSKLTKQDAVSAKTNSGQNHIKEKRTDLIKACKGVDVVVVKNDAAKKDDKKMGGDHMNAKMKSNYVGLDCEMVGIGLSGKQSALARCCMVDFEGEVIYDKYVRPKGFVTDFRTQWSGIRKQDLRAGEAITLLECQENVTALLKDKFLVGHALKNDLDVLMLGHPKKMIRDTACFKPYMRPSGRNGGKMKPRSLKELTKQHLGLTIQTGEHDPGEDARSAMFLYRMKMKEWEEGMRASRALQAAAFKNKLGGATTSSTAGVSTTDTPVQAEVEKQPDVVFKSGKEKDRDSGLSAKEIRNMRRNGTPSKRKSEEESVSVSESVSTSFSTSSVSSSSSGGKRGRDNSGISSTGGRNAIVSKSVGGSGSAGGSGSVSGSSSSSSVSEKKRKQPGTSDTGMFYNDVSSATSITDIDKRMGTKTTAGVSSKKQRR